MAAATAVTLKVFSQQIRVKDGEKKKEKKERQREEKRKTGTKFLSHIHKVNYTCSREFGSDGENLCFLSWYIRLQLASYLHGSTRLILVWFFFQLAQLCLLGSYCYFFFPCNIDRSVGKFYWLKTSPCASCSK